MIRHAFAQVLLALARRIDPQPPAPPTQPYVYTASWPTTPWPYQVWLGSQSPKRRSSSGDIASY